MQGSKLMFSDTELELASNRGFILTKNAVIHKVYEQFGHLGNILFGILRPLQLQFPDVFGIIPKISRGENYGGYPWLMLDYPRYFDKQAGHCAIRTFFWWGHYYLAQVQVSGEFKLRLIEKLEEVPGLLEDLHFPAWIGIPEDPYDFNVPQKGILPYQASMTESLKSGEGILKILIPVPIEKGQHLERILPLLASLFFGND